MPMEKSFNAAEAEPRITAKWEETGAFKAGANKSRDDSFCIMIPPPNVTGALHVGHAFNNTLQDILVRWHRMRGFDTLWQPGQDHAGIATQLQVEKKLMADEGKRRTDLSRDEFLAKVWEWKGEYGDTIINQLKRLGSSCDWSRNAFTMSGAPGAPDRDAQGNFHDAVIKVFVEMYNKGLIYRGKRLVNWDPHFETAISDLEVENIETPGHMWHFKYPLAGGATYTYVEKDADGNVILEEERDYISIATTRPETMLGDGAVAVHPSDERYAPIVGKLCEIPVGPKEHRRLIPIITDDYPDPNFGSGAVKITGAHDFNDYGVALRNGIPLYNLMDTKGAMRADGKPYAEEAALARAIAEGHQSASSVDTTAVNLVPEDYRGLDRYAARDKVVADITAEGLAVMTTVTRTEKDDDGNEVEVTETVPYVEAKPIMQPFGDRSKVVIEPMLTDQWFVDAEKLAGPALDAVRKGDIKIMPDSGEKTYYHWLDNIEPWCISRQLWWGHQIPVWFDADGNEYCAATEAEAQAKAGPGVDLTRDPDVLDTWFSSGLWPIGTLGWPEDTDELNRFFPTSVLITGQDILFFWVARMIMMQLAVVDQIPFHTVYLHGLVRDEKGKKMSKTTGNVIDPLDIIDDYGADALRFTNAAMASIGGVLKLSEDRIKGYRNFVTKIWNAARFAEMNGVFENGSNRTDGAVKMTEMPTPTHTVNRWIIGEVAKARVEVDAALDAYRFNDAAQTLYAFVWGKVCDWYVEFAKPLLQNDNSAEQVETRDTMRWVLEQCFILLHPIMPFVTEELWDTLTDHDKMLCHANWPEYGTDIVDENADREMNWVIDLIEQIRSVRAQMRVPAGLYVPVLKLELNAAGETAYANNATLIKRLARIEDIAAADEAPKGAITIAVEGGTFCLPLADIIDIAAEKARLEKTVKKLDKELGGMRGRLNNPKFIASAPEEVVEETKANLAQGEEELARLTAALERLAEVA